MRDIKIFAKTVEQGVLDQLERLLSQEVFADCKIRIMPDTHAGKGCVIGFTANLGDKVVPNIVGVDIGCGMLTVELGNIPLDFNQLDAVIRQYVPSGMQVHEGRIVHFAPLQELCCYRSLKDTRRLERSIGTLGGGNHFIEVDADEAENRYLIIHTGSRNLGKQVAEYYQHLAYELLQGKDELLAKQRALIEEYKAQGRRAEIHGALAELRKNFRAREVTIPEELAYLTGEYREQYLHDMRICQQFASLNRATIAQTILERLGLQESARFETIHNYIDHRGNMVRKGAISAQKGEKLLIPVNMRDGCILGLGKGNADWNFSAPHGAGRLMSRHQAREALSLTEYRRAMEGVFTTSVSEATLDEAPMAYKSLEEIAGAIGDSVEISKIIKPVYNFKAGD